MDGLHPIAAFVLGHLWLVEAGLLLRSKFTDPNPHRDVRAGPVLSRVPRTIGRSPRRRQEGPRAFQDHLRRYPSGLLRQDLRRGPVEIRSRKRWPGAGQNGVRARFDRRGRSSPGVLGQPAAPELRDYFAYLDRPGLPTVLNSVLSRPRTASSSGPFPRVAQGNFLAQQRLNRRSHRFRRR